MSAKQACEAIYMALKLLWLKHLGRDADDKQLGPPPQLMSKLVSDTLPALGKTQEQVAEITSMIDGFIEVRKEDRNADVAIGDLLWQLLDEAFAAAEDLKPNHKKKNKIEKLETAPAAFQERSEEIFLSVFDN